MLVLVLPEHQRVVVVRDAALESREHLCHLVMEDARAVGRPEEEPLHPAEVRLEDHLAAGGEWYLVEAVTHVKLTEHLGSL